MAKIDQDFTRLMGTGLKSTPANSSKGGMTECSWSERKKTKREKRCDLTLGLKTKDCLCLASPGQCHALDRSVLTFNSEFHKYMNCTDNEVAGPVFFHPSNPSR